MGRIVVCLFALIFALSVRCHAATYNWTGAANSDWTNRSNWLVGSTVPSTPPTAADDVFIGNSGSFIFGTGSNLFLSGTSFISQPSIPAGNLLSCATLTFGTAKAVTLTIAGTSKLTVAGNFTQRHGTGTNLTAALTGAGSLSCNNLLIGDATTPSAPFLGLYNQINTTQFNSTITDLNISNQLTLNTTSSSASLLILFATVMTYNLNNAQFNLNGGSTRVGNAITTTNSSFVSASPTLKNTARVSVNASTSAANLYLTGTASVSLDAEGAGIVDFYNNGAFASTIIYNSDNGAASQQVYTSTKAGVDGSPSIYQNIRFANAAAKSIQSGTITIAGDWDSTGGTVDAVSNNPTVTFQGGTQNLTDATSGVVFKTVNFTGGSTKTMSTGSFGVASTGILTMSATSTLNANGRLTLLSDATSTANIETIPTGSKITNNVNVQRYLVGSSAKSGGVYIARGYRMLSSPVNISGTGFYSLNYIGSTALTGGLGTGFTVVNNNPTIYLYREDVVASNTGFNSGKHKGITSINADNTVAVSGTVGTLQVPVGNGYIFYFVGNTSNAAAKTTNTPTAPPESTIITATGPLNQGDVNVNLWYTPAGATTPTANKLSYTASLGTSAGYNMVGNPYAATLDLNKVMDDNSTINTYAYVLDNQNPGQGYIAYSRAGASNPRASQYVTSGQGFMVKAKAANATLTFRESQKAAFNKPTILLMGIPVAHAEVTGFYLKIEKDSLVNDYCGVYFNGTSSKFDEDDAKDLDGTSPQVYMSSYTADGVRTAINRMPDYHQGAMVRLYANATTDGLYKLRVEGIRNMDTLYNIWLKDKYTRDSLDIGRYGTYNFRIIRSDTASFGGNRFSIVIRRKPLAAYQLVKFSAERMSGGIKVSWKTNNEGTYTGFAVEKLTAAPDWYETLYSMQSDGRGNYSFTDPAPDPGKNTYRLKQDNIDGVSSFSAPVNVNITEADQNHTSITVYPNPAESVIAVSVNEATQTPACVAKVFDHRGVEVMRKTVQGNNWSQNVSKLMPGLYIIELTKNTGELIGRTKFIKK